MEIARAISLRRVLKTGTPIPPLQVPTFLRASVASLPLGLIDPSRLEMQDQRMETEAIRQKTKAFIQVHFKTYELQDDDDIFSLGFVNSMFAMQLVMFVEKEFQLKVQDDDLLIDNFRSVNAVTDLVTRKMPA